MFPLLLKVNIACGTRKHTVTPTSSESSSLRTNYLPIIVMSGVCVCVCVCERER